MGFVVIFLKKPTKPLKLCSIRVNKPKIFYILWTMTLPFPCLHTSPFIYSLYFTLPLLYLPSSPSGLSISLFSVSPSSLYSLCFYIINLFFSETFLVGSIWWWLGFRGGDSVVPELVLVVGFNDGADPVVSFSGEVESVGGSMAGHCDGS